ncbi:hypothetical protein G7046_g7553 [Stylonectria norvegica]|nr:hypothetical protein G7046_g7553 [Stylonectria norvegica]
MSLPNADTELDDNHRSHPLLAAETFVNHYYQAINTRAALLPFYINSSSRYAISADISINGAVVPTPADYLTLLEGQGPNVHYEIESFDAHVMNPSFQYGAPDNIQSNTKLERNGQRMSIVVTTMGRVQFGRGREAPQKMFNETFVLPQPQPQPCPPSPKGSSKAPNPEPQRFVLPSPWSLISSVSPPADLPPSRCPAAPEPPPETVGQRSQLRFFQTNPLEKRRQDVGLPGLTALEKKTYAHANLILPVAQRRVPLSNKTEREFWKQVTKEGLPIRHLPRNYNWGEDKTGRDIATYQLDEFEQRTLKHARLTALNILHRHFLNLRERAAKQGNTVSEEDTEEEKKRRKAMAALKRDLYGDLTGPLAQDPEWDDVMPISQDEPEGALAQIAYPDEYAEAISYLRAVMAAEECSPRCLRLTENVIYMNPAHYTVWLYRFKIISVLQLSIPDEITWLNEVALANLKNYQIWNHRQLLMDYYHPTIASDATTLKSLARTETLFINKMLAEDTKNYHVWSYRQYLVGKLGMWDALEVGWTQNFIEDDVRNNSAWAHRFYVVFSNPATSTEGSGPTEHDAAIPDSLLDREIAYAQEKIALAPQNQSPWNYLLGTLTKGGCKVGSVKEFAEGYVSGLGEEDEVVKSSHALDLLAKAYEEEGEKEKAKLCLRRLSEKWDPVRVGYWDYRVTMLGD